MLPAPSPRAMRRAICGRAVPGIALRDFGDRGRPALKGTFAAHRARRRWLHGDPRIRLNTVHAPG